MRDSGALTELLLTRCTEKLRFPPQEAYGEATGITPWSARSIIWPMYARPIRISRGVIPAVRSCSYPDGWLRDDQRERDSGEGCSARGLNAVGEGAALTDIAFEPVSSNRSLRCGETEFSGQRQTGRNGLGDSRTPVQRQNLARQLRQFGANRRVPGNLR